MKIRADQELRWGKSTVETACPLDCPDNCTLAVSVEKGKVVSIDGGRRHSLTNGFIWGGVALSERVNMALRWTSSDEIAGPPLSTDIFQIDFNAKF